MQADFSTIKSMIKDVYKIKQGVAMSKPSLILGKFKSDRVWIGGEATLKNKLSIEV